ncbi:hypothetical protein JCM19241_2547 [Vibrio ishigakensis]|uniref:Uncharacterized protein n=1 Tax=Vibrio ishigakensis TaxID=1481914 RepID=A0A0B8Q819_9VIBR|nr:hypothetical protein JCM19241_2547 [Vibrio ishigakensis]
MISQYANFSQSFPIVHKIIVTAVMVGIVGSMAAVLYYESIVGLLCMPITFLPIIFFGKASSYKAKFCHD